MTTGWPAYFPFESGTSFAVEAESLGRGSGLVIERTDTSLSFSLHAPGTFLRDGIDVRIDVDYSGEGPGNRLAVSRHGGRAVEDFGAIVQSDAGRSARIVSSSVPFDGHHLLIELTAADRDTAAITVDAHAFRLRRTSVPRASPSAALQSTPPVHAKAAPSRTAIQDWSTLVAFNPAVYCRPQSIEQLQSFVSAVAQGTVGRGRLRTIGGLHSCSQIDVSDTIVDLADLPKILVWSDDGGTVTASANHSLHEFLAALSVRGKSLQATGGTDGQTLAGLISTNTAPATPAVGIYDNLQWVEYVTVDPATKQATTRRVSRGDADFLSTVCSLGAIGVLTAVQFKVVDELFFKTTQQVMKLDAVLGDLDATSRQYDFWRIDWLPKMDVGLFWGASRIPKKDADPNGDYPQDKDESILDFLFKFDSTILGQAGPLLTTPMEWVYKILKLLYEPLVVTGPLRNMLPVDRRAPLLVAMAEWGFAPKDLPAVRAICVSYFDKNGWPNIPVEIELTKSDGYSMSAWNWKGPPYIVKFNFMYLTETCRTPAERQAISIHLQGLWNALAAAKIPFKAHWGKLNFMDPAFVAENFDLASFRPLVRELFLNDYVAQRLG